MNMFDLNQLPFGYEREEEPQSNCLSSSSQHIFYNIPKTLTNPNDSQTSPSTKGKRPLLVQEGIKNKKAKTKHNKASSSSGRMIDIDLNKVPCDELEESPESSKKPRPRRSKKAKKTPRPEAALEVAEINSSPPEWLVEVMRKMNGAVARFVFVKTLKETDVNQLQSRLLIPFKKLKSHDFLTSEESKNLQVQVGDNKKKGKKRPQLETSLFNEESQKCRVFLRIWNMDKNGNYVLAGGWNNFVSANKLEEGHKISLWSFRCQGALSFALHKTI